MHRILSKHVSAQKLDFLYMNVCVYKWASVDTHAHTRVWKHMRWGIWVFFFDTIFIVMLVYIFFLGHYVVHLLLLGCVATHAFFMGHILKIMGWVWDLPYLDLGPKWVPQWRRILTCLGNSSEPSVKIWDLKLVSNFNLGIIWLGWPSKSQTG